MAGSVLQRICFGSRMFLFIATSNTLTCDCVLNLIACVNVPVWIVITMLSCDIRLTALMSRLQRHRSAADTLMTVADEIGTETRVLCMDEFFVTDVADAVILNRLFGRLFDKVWWLRS